jgi:hypothetical protein
VRQTLLGLRDVRSATAINLDGPKDGFNPEGDAWS